MSDILQRAIRGGHGGPDAEWENVWQEVSFQEIDDIVIEPQCLKFIKKKLPQNFINVFLIRLMAVATWDGRTKYKVEESAGEETERLDQWEKYLQEGEDAKE